MKGRELIMDEVRKKGAICVHEAAKASGLSIQSASTNLTQLCKKRKLIRSEKNVCDQFKNKHLIYALPEKVGYKDLDGVPTAEPIRIVKKHIRKKTKKIVWNNFKPGYCESQEIPKPVELTRKDLVINILLETIQKLSEVNA